MKNLLVKAGPLPLKGRETKAIAPSQPICARSSQVITRGGPVLERVRAHRASNALRALWSRRY
jgi:hypothetical protein